MAAHQSIPQECSEGNWLIEPLTGTVTHRPTGLRFQLEPTVKGLMRYGRQATLEARGLRVVGQCSLPQGTPDFRSSSMLDDGPAGREFAAWAVLVDRASVDRATEVLGESVRYPLSEVAKLMVTAGKMWISCVQALRRAPAAEAA